MFAALFVLQAAIFSALALRSRAYARIDLSPRSLVGGVLVLCGLAYPFVGLGLGLRYPRAPLFAVPCPTTLVTAGLLVMSLGVPKAVNVVPLLWALIGGTAAFALGIQADMALLVAAAVLALDTFAPRVLGASRAALAATGAESP